MRITLRAILILVVTSHAVSAQVLPFSSGWDISGANIRVERGERGEELVVENGIAHRRDVTLQDGTIDFDVKLGHRRSFVHIGFRMANDEEFEEFYLRTHKSGLPDAVQYAPVRQRHSAWQLYHGPGSTAAPALTPDVWTAVRVVLKGSQAALFIGDLSTPVLVARRLGHESRPGYLALRGFIPAGTTGTGPAARFANVRVRPGEVSFVFPPPPPLLPETGLVVKQWAVSKAELPAALKESDVPEPADAGAFTLVQTNADGLLELHKSVRLPEGSRTAAAVARVTVRADAARIVPMDLGFSDVATVFVNGRPVFRGDGSYSFDTPRRDGLIGYDNARLFLPLQAGDNTVTVVVADGFGGWGLMARFLASTGLTIVAK